MKKLFIYIFLTYMFNLSPGFADKWTLASKSVSGSVESYVDKNSIKSNGNLVVFWMLNSYKEKLNVEDAIIFFRCW